MSEATGNVQSFDKGQVIFKEGQPSNVAYMIKKGVVNICKCTNNKKIILTKLQEGEIFGEMGVITKGPRSTDAEAAEHCDLLVLTDPLISTLLSKSPRTIQLLTKALIQRLHKTDKMVPEMGHPSAFLSICRIIEIAFCNHITMPPKEAKNTSNHALGINVDQLCKTVQSIIQVTDHDIESTLQKLSRMNIVELTRLKSAQQNSEKYVRINDLTSFHEVSTSLYKELQQAEFSLTSELQYVDLRTFSEYVEADPRTTYKKIGNQEFPETLFFLHKDQALAWADEQGKDFFKAAENKKKKPGEFDDVNDIVHLDNAALKEVLGRLGYYKIGVLLSLAGDKARKKVLANLSKKIAAATEEEAAQRHVDETEAEDLQMELLDHIRDVKGVAGQSG
jgi:CRP-like cAMP-binding protein